MMNVSEVAQATMLLTIYLKGVKKSHAKPLTSTELEELSSWLQTRGENLASLLKDDVAKLLEGYHKGTSNSDSITARRIQQLLGRGTALAMALEKWQRVGIWLLHKDDADYPHQIKEKLANNSLPILFGCGDKGMLQGDSDSRVAIVGSRMANEDDMVFAINLGEECANNGYIVVSGCAKGIDQASMTGALNNKGKCIGVVAGNLFRQCMSKFYRDYIRGGQLTLLSPFPPDSVPISWKLMSRNKYIYCLADASVVVSAKAGKSTAKIPGGTFNGACENLEKHWTRLWVYHSSDTENSQNQELVDKGAEWLHSGILENISQLFGKQSTEHQQELIF